MDTQTDYDHATQRVEEKLGFYTHLGVYVVVNAGLTVLDLFTTPEVLWFYWPLAGWGIGVALHAWNVLSAPAVSRMKQRMVQRELDREEEQSANQPPASVA